MTSQPPASVTAALAHKTPAHVSTAWAQVEALFDAGQHKAALQAAALLVRAKLGMNTGLARGILVKMAPVVKQLSAPAGPTTRERLRANRDAMLVALTGLPEEEVSAALRALLDERERIVADDGARRIEGER